jgi:hypothetical protein
MYDPTCKPTAIRTFGWPFFGLYGSTPGSTSPTSSSKTASKSKISDLVYSINVKLTFCTTFRLLASFPLSAPPSIDAFTLALTFCRKDETSLTLTSDSSRAAQTSFSNTSRTCDVKSLAEPRRIVLVLAYLVIDNGSSIKLCKCGIDPSTKIR